VAAVQTKTKTMPRLSEQDDSVLSQDFEVVDKPKFCDARLWRVAGSGTGQSINEAKI